MSNYRLALWGPLDETRRTAGHCALYAHDGDLDSFCDLVEQLCGDAAALR